MHTPASSRRPHRVGPHPVLAALALAAMNAGAVVTVNGHVARILAKLEVHSRREAVERCRELGLLTGDVTSVPDT